jgi:predicted transposase YdaD
MTTVMQMIWDEAREEAIQKRDIEIAKKAIKRGLEIDFISDITGLETETIQQLQAELNEQ